MSKNRLKFLSLVGLRISIATCVLGWYMIIMHHSFGKFVFTIGAGFTILAYTLRTIFKDKRRFEDWIKLALVISIFSRGIIGTNHLPFPDLVWAILGGIILISIVILFFRDSSSLIPRARNHAVSKILFSAAGTFIAIGVLFKIMHWPYAAPLILVGNVSLILWLVIEPFLQPKTITDHSSIAFNEDLALDEILTQEQGNYYKVKRFSKYRPVFFLAVALMIIGLGMKVLSYPGASIVILAGFIVGGGYLFLTIKK